MAAMSHHFDTPTGREDPRLNLCDFYLFPGRPGTTLLAMTVNPTADPVAAPVFREEAVYAFRVDSDGDGREEVAFKVVFGEGRHVDDAHVQPYRVLRASGSDAEHGAGGDVLAEGDTGAVVDAAPVRVYAGTAYDVFGGNAAGLQAFGDALRDGQFRPEHFDDGEDFFAERRVAAVVLEVPDDLVGTGEVHAWATVSLHGHAPEQQVAWWGLPLVTHLFLGDDETREAFNRTPPSGDLTPFLAHVVAAAETATSLAGTAPDPRAYAQQLLARLGRLTLPYEVGFPASFDVTGFNGRALGDDVMDVMLTLMADRAIDDGAAPHTCRTTDSFPYFTAAAR